MPDLHANSPLYPLKFRPRLVPKIWGGRRLQTSLGKPLPPAEPIGECWELYDFPPGAVHEASGGWLSAAVAEGALAGRTLHELMLAMPHRLLGQAPPSQTEAGPQFPILVKYLDARQDLSIQVHPDEVYAAAHPGAQVKNEAWYVLEHRPGARLLKGLLPGTSREDLQHAITAGEIERLVRSVPARAGDVHYLPSGTVHALGAGMLVAEIQTPSDTTFRLHDFGRIDPATGGARELHIHQALEALDLAAEDDAPPAAVRGAADGVLASAPQFTLSRWSAQAGTRAPLAAGVPGVLIILRGDGRIVGNDFGEVRLGKGDTILIPADLAGPQLEAASDCRWLEVKFPGA